MNKYSITFYGRTKNSIGCFYTITDVRIADDEQKALLALYDEFEHVQQPVIRLIKATS